jgi:uncharacterized membrane protein YkvA (DUF1232 family)
MRDYSKYYRYFTKSKFHRKTNRLVRKSGEKILYNAFLLYYTMLDGEVSLKNKALIIAVLGYFIFPFDSIPDFIPALGFTDDLAALLFAIDRLKHSIRSQNEEKAKAHVQKLLERN